ncbi:hypothetical protein [Permianibacter aggregans]|uniref:YqjK-like protein n=1 Tax=Permianibacter aggregans TaxID=1510150 RepID=A0A4R6UE83_9GAMM|nr:hypothetical protein [Permianibacter aggregans]QGX38499.1 hypothetical protein E2H98_01975 [Permianibacter aggregans]TDQ45058.1 hypothetical protein EV696_12117 [Permianibacter aggregans]
MNRLQLHREIRRTAGDLEQRQQQVLTAMTATQQRWAHRLPPLLVVGSGFVLGLRHEPGSIHHGINRVSGWFAAGLSMLADKQLRMAMQQFAKNNKTDSTT